MLKGLEGTSLVVLLADSYAAVVGERLVPVGMTEAEAQEYRFT